LYFFLFLDDVHPLKQMEPTRIFFGLSYEGAINMLRFLLHAVDREDYVGPVEELDYDDVRCEDCGVVHTD
jgi:hypothetical protein